MYEGVWTLAGLLNLKLSYLYCVMYFTDYTPGFMVPNLISLTLVLHINALKIITYL